MTVKYTCGTCDSQDLILTPMEENLQGWTVTCGNGHEIKPTLGTMITILGERIEGDK